MSAPDPQKAYDARLADLRAAARALERRSGSISTARGLTFLAAVAVVLARLARPLPSFAWAIAAASAAAFVALVVIHAVLVTRMANLDLRIRLVERGKQRIAGDIAGIPERGERFVVPDHAYLGDLDVFGSSSLFQLLSAAQTGPGERALAGWLSAPAGAEEIAARQAAVRELAALPAYREELAVDGAESGTRGREVDPIVDWSEGRVPPRRGQPASVPAPLSLPLARAGQVLVVITVGLLVAGQIVDAHALGRLRHLWIAPFVIQLGVLGLLSRAMDPILAIISSPEQPFGRYQALIRRVEGQPFESARLAALRATLAGSSGADASRAIGSLQRIVGFAELRHNGMIYLLLNALLLWDVFCALALHRWRARHGREVRAWLSALAEMEALASLATFSFEHPGFAFPEVSEGDPDFEAEGLGHPLIPASKRVCNDVSLGGAGGALMITGSNMSGKSTLLRSVGVSAVLALAGAPVCARRLRMSAVKVRTSMRIKDSLEEGVSHFYAELARLKAVVDAVNAGDRVLFLLDEVLHGTNSRERQIGAKAVVKHLLARGATGAVSSHDLGLADLERESGGRVRNVHFEELVKDDKMSFDYKLKPGVVKTANALRLMKLIGIAVDLPDAP